MQAKLSELWTEVEKGLSEQTSSGAKMAILESLKILKVVLDSKGYPGKTLEKQLFWAGYSLKEKEGLAEVLTKEDEILNKFDFRLSDLEAEEIVKKVKHVITEINGKPKFSPIDKFKVYFENYFSPKSLLFWRNLAILIAVFTAIKILAYTEFGKELTSYVVDLADFIISWAFVAIIIGIAIIFLVATNYLKNKSKVKIKEEE